MLDVFLCANRARALSAVFVAVASAAFSAQNPPAAPVANDDDLAIQITFDDETATITRGEYANWLTRWRGEYYAVDFARSDRVRRAAREAKVEPASSAVEESLRREVDERVHAAFGGRREGWLAELAAIGRSEAGWLAQRRVELGDELCAAAMLAREGTVDPDRIQRAFESRYGRGGRRYELDWIRLDVVVPTPEGLAPKELERVSERERQAVFERARALAAQARAGADFGELAKQNSTDRATRDAGGRLDGYFEPKYWSNEALEQLSKLTVGAISDPIWAAGGWQIVRPRKVSVTKLEDVRSELDEAARHQSPTTSEIARWMKKTSENAAIELDPNLWAEGLQPLDQVLLRVDGRAVTRREFEALVVPLRAESEMESFVEQWLVKTAARRAGITVGEDELVARIHADIEQRIDEQFDHDQSKWKRTLAAQGRTEESFFREQRAKLGHEMLAEKLFQRERHFTEDDLKRAWELRYGPGGRKLQVRMIQRNVRVPLVQTDMPREEYQRRVAEASEAMRREMSELRARVVKGEDFGKLAAELSEDFETRTHRGEFSGGWKPERFQPDVAAKVMALKKGDISEPIWFADTWALFQVVDETLSPYEKVKPELEGKLRADRPTMAERAMYVNTLINRAKFEVLPALYR